MDPLASTVPSENILPIKNGIMVLRKNPAILAAGLIIGFIFFSVGAAMFNSGAKNTNPMYVVAPFFMIIILIFAFNIYQSNKSKQLRLKLDKPAYSPGEEITGNLILDFSKEKQARSLKVRFYGMQHRGKHHYRVCPVEIVLSGARTYRRGESFSISLAVPGDAAQYVAQPGGYGHVSEWYVEAQLDIPNEVDFLRRERITLQAAPGAQPAV